MHWRQLVDALVLYLLTVVLCPFTVVHERLKKDHGIWQRRPLPAQMLRYAAEDVSQLLTLAAIITSELGKAALKMLPQLSKANAQWYWDPADKDSAQAADSYR